MNNILKDLTMKMKKEDLSNNVMILLEIINEQDQKIDKAIKYIKELQNSCIVFSNIAYKELLEILGGLNVFSEDKNKI